LLGNVLGVGGLREKVLAAQQANIKTLIIPAENQKDLSEIPNKIRQRMHFIPVETMDDVINAALLTTLENEETSSPTALPREPRLLRADEKPLPPPIREQYRPLPAIFDEPQEQDNQQEKPPMFIVPPPEPSHETYPHARQRQEEN